MFVSQSEFVVSGTEFSGQIQPVICPLTNYCTKEDIILLSEPNKLSNSLACNIPGKPMANLQYVIERKTIFLLKLTLLIGIKSLSILFFYVKRARIRIH